MINNPYAVSQTLFDTRRAFLPHVHGMALGALEMHQLVDWLFITGSAAKQMGHEIQRLQRLEACLANSHGLRRLEHVLHQQDSNVVLISDFQKSNKDQLNG